MVKQDKYNLKIYTKTGDKGETSLFGGKRVSKADLRVEAYGTVDELNSIIGIVISKIKNRQIKKELTKIQIDLFEIGSLLASENSTNQGFEVNLEERIRQLEKVIDTLSEKTPKIKNFILPQGTEASSFLHFTRSVTRRVERRVIELSKKEKVDKQILIYLNRLSDLFFVMARYINHQEKNKEITWKKIDNIG